MRSSKMKVIFISVVTAFLAVGCIVLPEDHDHRHGDRYGYDRNHNDQNDRDEHRWGHADGHWRYADRDHN
ncbi:hypothetical protein [Acinetobacter guerrae]|nr:hypothetical protein [Acinetobacter guerrae]